MPPPEPRSRTVSPSLSWASSVGLPHPSEARTACSGIWLVWSLPYKLLVIASQQPSETTFVAQQAEPALTCLAAAAYFCFTTSLIFSVLIAFSYLQIVT